MSDAYGVVGLEPLRGKVCTANIDPGWKGPR